MGSWISVNPSGRSRFIRTSFYPIALNLSGPYSSHPESAFLIGKPDFERHSACEAELRVGIGILQLTLRSFLEIYNRPTISRPFSGSGPLRSILYLSYMEFKWRLNPRLAARERRVVYQPIGSPSHLRLTSAFLNMFETVLSAAKLANEDMR
jgi:hypothetical protein